MSRAATTAVSTDCERTGGASATGPMVNVRARVAIKEWNWVARSTVTGSPLRSSAISVAYLAR